MTDPYAIIETYLIIDSKRQQGRRQPRLLLKQIM